ncbi:single-stranded DNA-binding protein [Salibacterium aidingense]|uniref:single-stranded DNA-binding protein n=1 Tax=Salibacterium aidingense TaxID=384933 RepID=UPI00040DB5E3|nr:single-stranded DNA-binding protein [Salibacterium aidingense]
MDINRFVLHGRLTVPPELRYTEKSIAMVRFPIACERPYQASSEGGKKVDYIPVLVWREYAERVANNLQRGQECAVTGRLQSMVRQDAHMNRHEVMAQDVIFGQHHRGLAKDINQAFFTGRLTKDPELHYVGADSVAVCRFMVVVERDYKPRGAEKADTDYIPVLAWRSYAERLANDLKTGMGVAVIGRLQARKHQQQPSVSMHEVHAEQVKYGN